MSECEQRRSHLSPTVSDILSSHDQSDIDRFVKSKVDKPIFGPTRRFRARKVSS